MDTSKPETLRISRNTEDITAHHFFKMKDTGDLRWMVPSFTGWEDFADKLPEDTEEVALDIKDEYSKLSKDNSVTSYMECIDDIELLTTRIYGASILLDAVRARWKFMSEDIRKEYVETLGHWNFILTTSKPLDKEIERLHRQLRASKTKLARLKNDRKELEAKSAKKGVDLWEIVVLVKNALKRDFDWKVMSLKEWHFTVASLSSKNKHNGGK